MKRKKYKYFKVTAFVRVPEEEYNGWDEYSDIPFYLQHELAYSNHGINAHYVEEEEISGRHYNKEKYTTFDRWGGI